jgi:hypothetical protein
MPHQNSHIQFGKDLFSNSIYNNKICLIIYNFFYLISLGYAAPYPCHPLAPSMILDFSLGLNGAAHLCGTAGAPQAGVAACGIIRNAGAQMLTTATSGLVHDSVTKSEGGRLDEEEQGMARKSTSHSNGGRVCVRGR